MALHFQPEEQLVTTLSNMFIVEEMTKYDASVSCLSDDPSDLHEADSIANYLRSKKKTVLKENINRDILMKCVKQNGTFL